MAVKAQKGKPKPKGKPAAKPRPVAKPKPGSKAAADQARRMTARQERKTEPRHRPAPVQAQPASQSIFYNISKFFWLLFHPGKTASDFAAQYRRS